jgi:hypothetical protein
LWIYPKGYHTGQLLAGLFLLQAAGAACAQTPVSVADSYGIPLLEIEPLGVLENNTLDGENAGENGATVTLLRGVGFRMTAHSETPLAEYPIKRRALVNSTLAFCQQRECICWPLGPGESHIL